MIKELFLQAWNTAHEMLRRECGEKWEQNGSPITPCEMKALREQHVALAQKLDSAEIKTPAFSTQAASSTFSDSEISPPLR